MLPLLWPRIACRVSSATPAARNRRTQPPPDRVPQVMHVQRAKAVGWRLTEPFLVLGNCPLASVEPCGVVDAAERLAAPGEYRGGVLAAAALDDRTRHRVQHADVILLVLSS